MDQEAVYHSSGSFTLSPQKWMEKAGVAFQLDDSVLLAVRAMTLAGAGRIEVRCWWGRCEVCGIFASPPAAWLDERGWNPALRGDWPDRLLQPDHQGLYDLCLAVAAGVQGSHCQLRWKQGWSSSRLDFSGWEPPTSATHSAPVSDGPLKIAFSCSPTSTERVGQQVLAATRYSPIPVVYMPGSFQSAPGGRPAEYLHELGLLGDCRLVQWLDPPTDQHWGRSLGVPGKATLDLPGLDPQRPTREVFWRTAHGGPVPVSSGGLPLAERLLQIEVANGPGSCTVVRGGVTLEKRPLPLSGIQLVLCDRGLQLDVAGMKVVDNEDYQRKIAETLVLVPELCIQAEKLLLQLDFLAPVSHPGEQIGTLVLGLTMLLGALAGADISAGSTFNGNGSGSTPLGSCQNPARLELFREAVRKRLRSYQEV